MIVPFIAIGLDRGERCLYIAEDNSVALITAELEKGGVDVQQARASGALTIGTKHESYLRHGLFEPVQMIRDLLEEVKESLRLGYSAFRATGEMTWALSLPSALTQLASYETQLHAQCPSQFLGLCQYDERGFNEKTISDMIRIHPVVIARGKLLQNRFHPPGATVETFLPDPVTVAEVVASSLKQVQPISSVPSGGIMGQSSRQAGTQS